jgi:hypothetical protein
MADELDHTMAPPSEASSLPLQVIEVDEDSPQVPRRSTRARRPVGGWLEDSVVYASRASSGEEPTTLHEALQEMPVEWQEAVIDELQSHAENGTWVPVDGLPMGKKEISSKWVFKKKTNVDGSIHYKARLVV